MEFLKDNVAHVVEKFGLLAPVKALWASSPTAVITAGTVVLLIVAYNVHRVRFLDGIRTFSSKVTLAGKTVIITGGNAGIGRETAVDLARRGARVILACRNPKKAHAAVLDVRRRSGSNDVVFRLLDLSDLTSVRTFGSQITEEEDRLDILINNAGIGVAEHQLTAEGFDTIFATNHIGHFVLTLLVIDLLRKTAPTRIINVSSGLHFNVEKVDFINRPYKRVDDKWYPYARSKLANVLFTKELARRLNGTGVTSYSVHPGIIYSSIWETASVSYGFRGKLVYWILKPVLWLLMLTETQGAQTTVYCAVDESITHLSGRYFFKCRLGKESELAKDSGGHLAKQLWDVSCEATGLNPNSLPPQDNEI